MKPKHVEGAGKTMSRESIAHYEIGFRHGAAGVNYWPPNFALPSTFSNSIRIDGLPVDVAAYQDGYKAGWYLRHA